MDKFKEYSIKQTKKIVDDSYNDWIIVKNEYGEKEREAMSKQIYLTYEGDIKHNDFIECKEYWFEKFKDEEMVFSKLQREFGWWK